MSPIERQPDDPGIRRQAPYSWEMPEQEPLDDGEWNAVSIVILAAAAILCCLALYGVFG